MVQPIIDLHCDLLSYLLSVPNADATDTSKIGCSLPALEAGNVRLQIMAIYTSSENGSADRGLRQSQLFGSLLHKFDDRLTHIRTSTALNTLTSSHKVGMIAAIENASGFCAEDDSLESGFNNLETIIQNTGSILYIGFTHHGENRFGGGNMTDVGLKKDGKSLLKYMSGRKIALDFAHTSDALAYDMIEYIEKHNLDIPIIASHSNFRSIFNHPRNLPDDIAKEIIGRNGLIGLNFLRAFLHNENADVLYEHIQYGIQLGAESNLCFGADYFYTGNHPDQTRRPFYHKAHENASCYPAILSGLSRHVSEDFIEKISSKNAINFAKRIWEEV